MGHNAPASAPASDDGDARDDGDAGDAGERVSLYVSTGFFDCTWCLPAESAAQPVASLFSQPIGAFVRLVLGNSLGLSALAPFVVPTLQVMRGSECPKRLDLVKGSQMLMSRPEPRRRSPRTRLYPCPSRRLPPRLRRLPFCRPHLRRLLWCRLRCCLFSLPLAFSSLCSVRLPAPVGEAASRNVEVRVCLNGRCLWSCVTCVLCRTTYKRV